MPSGKGSTSTKKAAVARILKDKKKKGGKSFIILVVALVLLVGGAIAANFALGNPLGDILAGLGQTDETVPVAGVPATQAEGDIRIHFIDVGQGDAILIESGSHAVLVDGGPSPRLANENILPHIRSLGITRLDYVISTHPHLDHIGGLPTIMDYLDVGHVLMPNATHTTRAFENFLDAIDNNNIPEPTIPYRGQWFSAGAINFQVVSPGEGDFTNNFNNGSIVIRMDHGSTSVLLTADAEIPAERSMLESDVNLNADLMLAGHHGSRTSSSQDFVDAINPRYAVISVGEGNRYNHPNQEVLDTFSERNVTVYRTDQLGTIIFITDGTTIRRYN